MKRVRTRNGNGYAISGEELKDLVTSLLSNLPLKVNARFYEGSADFCIKLTDGNSSNEADIDFDNRYVERVEIEGIQYATCNYYVGINWGSTRRDVANALAAVTVYETTVKLAARIQSVLSDVRYFEVEG